MAGFFDTLMGLGNAHQQHVQAVTAAFHNPDMQAARDQLAAYLQGLNDLQLLGFRTSLGLLSSQESNPQVQQGLQWIAQNMDGLRAGHFKAVTPQSLPRNGLTLEQVSALITPWAQMSTPQVQQQFAATMQALDGQGRAQWASHVDTLAQQVQMHIAQLQQQDDSSAWGSSYEDRMAYLQARITSGEPSQQQQAVAQQQGILQALLQLSAAARQWQDPAAAAIHQPTREPAPQEPSPGDAAQMLSVLQQQFETAKADMDPARAAALTDFMARLSERIAEGEQLPPLGDDATLDERRADLQRRMAHSSALRQQADELREMQRHVRRQPGSSDKAPAGERATAIGPLLDALVDDSAGLLNTPMAAQRETEQAQLQQLHLSLVQARARVRELAAQDADVLHYERDTLRSAVQALRLHHRRGHLMLARPLWPGGAARVEPGSVFCAGAQGAVREAIDQACEQRLLSLRGAAAPGVDPATALWRQLQAASLVVLDLSSADPQVYYQLGQAYALGTELLLLARRGTALPFDVAQAVLSYDDAEHLAAQLPQAMDAALYGVQTLGLSALMHATLQRCTDLVDKAVGPAHTPVLLKQLQAAVASPLDFRAALEQLLAQLGNSRLVMLHPRWPAHYPAAGSERRCFVVMPFAQALSDTQALYRTLDDALTAQGVHVVRGDEALGQDIVASIWEETARASHVLVDLTGYNLNVCLELGMADAMGRDTLLIGATGTPEQRFAVIDKRRIHAYGSDDASRHAVQAQVQAFVQRAPTLL
jgi:hypothetical protein